MARALYFFVPRTERQRPLFLQTLVFLLGAAAAGVAVLGLGAATKRALDGLPLALAGLAFGAGYLVALRFVGVRTR